MSAPIPRLLDTTMVEAFRACPRQFLIDYGMGRRPSEASVHLHAGRAFASALEAHRTGGDALLVLRREWGPPALFADEAKCLPAMEVALRTYVATFPDDRLALVEGRPAIELSWQVVLDPADGWPTHPSGEPFLYVGRADAILDQLGSLWLTDEKTTGGTFGPLWAAQWDRRTQFSAYVWGLRRSLGLDLAGALVRGISIRRLRRPPSPSPSVVLEGLPDGTTVAIATTEHYSPRPPHLLADFEASLRDTLRHLTSLAARPPSAWPSSGGSACTAYGRPCAHLPLCLAPAWHEAASHLPLNVWDPLTREEGAAPTTKDPSPGSL